MWQSEWPVSFLLVIGRFYQSNLRDWLELELEQVAP
jgi:hypothetical protein